MAWVYLDNNATTKPDPQVVAAMEKVYTQCWANPSSVHRFGQMARQQVELARASVARLVGCQDRELIFTSGGTESCNLALRGVLEPWMVGAKCRMIDDGQQPSALLITTRIEHAAVRESAEALEKMGVTVKWMPIEPGGWVRPESLAQLLEQHAPEAAVTLVSVQWANNETGVIQPISEIMQVVQRARESLQAESRSRRRAGNRVLMHVDATQAVGKMPVDVQAVAVDLLSFSSHKFHGPKGVGALYVRKGTRLNGQVQGGPQERQRRGGTENTACIVGMGVAAELAGAFVEDHQAIQRLSAWRDRFEEGVCRAVPDAVVNAPLPSLLGSSEAGAYQVGRLWNTSNLGFPRLESEAIILGLSERGLCASAGAACSSGSLEPSPVLLAMGVPDEVAHGSVRFSLSRWTTERDIDQAIALVIEVVSRLKRVMPPVDGGM